MRDLADELAEIFHCRTLAEQFAAGVLVVLREKAVDANELGEFLGFLQRDA
jgi:hypothetical protein